VICGFPSERALVATIEAVAPPPVRSHGLRSLVVLPGPTVPPKKGSILGRVVAGSNLVRD